MSTTNNAEFEVGSVAHVTFRVRCESLGHGDEVFLVPSGDKGTNKVRSSTAGMSIVLIACFVGLVFGVDAAVDPSIPAYQFIIQTVGMRFFNI
jgi:hypothetical protein